jgi:hypothetical protein
VFPLRMHLTESHVKYGQKSYKLKQKQLLLASATASLMQNRKMQNLSKMQRLMHKVHFYASFLANKYSSSDSNLFFSFNKFYSYNVSSHNIPMFVFNIHLIIIKSGLISCSLVTYYTA